MAGPYDEWRNTYGVPGPQDPRRQDNIWATEAPRWEELLRGSDVTAIKTNPLVQALGQYLSKPSTGIGEVTRVSPIDGRPVPPEPGVLDKLPPTVQEGIGGLGLLANFLAPGVKLPPVTPKPTGIRAYHGSPHDFDRFDMSKIGTGEGAQAYGHGLYFAEAEPVAKMYRDQLTQRTNFRTPSGNLWSADGLEHLNVRALASRGDLDGAIATAREIAANGSPVSQMAQRDLDVLVDLKARGGIEKNPGRIYEVNINADPERFLDWDKPLGGQTQPVKDALGYNLPPAAEQEATRLARQLEDVYARLGASPDRRPVDPIFARQAEYIERRLAELDPMGITKTRMNVLADGAEATKRLREAGIPGIRYKDAMSRDAPGGGTSNYVVFDDKLIEILRKYGLLPPAAAAGAALMEQQEPPL